MACQAKNIYCVALSRKFANYCFLHSTLFESVASGCYVCNNKCSYFLFLFLFLIFISTYKLYAYKLSEPGGVLGVVESNLFISTKVETEGLGSKEICQGSLGCDLLVKPQHLLGNFGS